MWTLGECKPVHLSRCEWCTHHQEEATHVPFHRFQRRVSLDREVETAAVVRREREDNYTAQLELHHLLIRCRLPITATVVGMGSWGRSSSMQARKISTALDAARVIHRSGTDQRRSLQLLGVTATVGISQRYFFLFDDTSHEGICWYDVAGI